MNLFSKIKNNFALDLMKLIASSLKTQEVKSSATKQSKLHLDNVVYEHSRSGDGMKRDRYIKL